MKNSEIKELSLEDLKERIKSEQSNLQKLEFAHAITPIENPMKIKHSRKLIAQLKTQMTAKKAKA